MGAILIRFTDQTEQQLRQVLTGKKQGAIREYVEQAVVEKMEREKK